MESNNTTLRAYEIFQPSKNYAIGIYLFVIIVFSVLSNLLVIVSLGCKGSRLKPNNLPILALAVSDICFSLAIHPMLIVVSFGTPSEAIFSPSGCDWYGFGAIFFGCLSLLIHGSVSYARQKIMLHPTQGQWKRLPFHIVLLLIDVAIAFTFAIAPILGWGRYETFEFGCTVAFHDSSPSVRSYVVTMLVTILGLPLAVCVVSYAKIVHFYRRFNIELFTLQSRPRGDLFHGLATSQAPGNEPPVVDVFAEDTSHKAQSGLWPPLAEEGGRRRPLHGSTRSGTELISVVDKKLTTLTLMTAGAYLVGWTPFAVLSVWETFYPPTEIPVSYRIAAALLCKSATAFNPCIYFCMSQSFRTDLQVITDKLNPFLHKSAKGDLSSKWEPQRKKVHHSIALWEQDPLTLSDMQRSCVSAPAGGRNRDRAPMPGTTTTILGGHGGDQQPKASIVAPAPVAGILSRPSSKGLRAAPSKAGGYSTRSQNDEGSATRESSRRLPYFRDVK